MKFIKLDLLTLLISLFVFASCESTSTIGLEIDPSSAVQGDLIDTSTIVSRTMEEDPWPTNFSAQFPIGYLTDQVLGTTESSLAMTVGLPVAAYSFGTDPIVDSAVVVLKYGTNFYGDSTSTYSFEVHQLDFNLSRESSFLNTREYSYYPALLGHKTGRIYPTTPSRVTNIVTGAADTVASVSPQIRIPLDISFAQNALASLGESNLKTNAAFAAYFGGLHLKVNKASSSGKGGIAFLNLNDATSGITIYYKKNSTSGTGRDTVSTVFPISNSTTTPIAATVKHKYSGFPAGDQLSQPTVQFPVTYLQPLGGLRSKISFPQLSKLAANVGKIAINKAELVIDLGDGSDVIPFNAAPRLALYRYDIAEQRRNLPDNDQASQTSAGDIRAVSPTLFGGYYNATTKQYVFVLTSYIQDLLDGKTKDYGTFLAPTPFGTTAADIYPSFSTAARSIIGSFKKGAGVGEKTMKLNIYYTKIN